MAVACPAIIFRHSVYISLFTYVVYVLRTFFYIDTIRFILIYPYIDLIPCTSSLIGIETRPRSVDTSATCGGYTAGTKQPWNLYELSMIDALFLRTGRTSHLRIG
jgi:hypothetical protein